MADPLARWVRNTEKFERNLVRSMAQATRASADVLLQEMQALTAAIGHTLADLRALDHPYAKRHAPGSGPFADWITHIQGGALHRGLGRRAPVTGEVAITAEVHSEAAHTWFVAQDHTATAAGRMRPRDFISAAVIYREDEVAEFYRRAHARVHDVPHEQTDWKPVTTLIRHGSVAADLP